MEGIDFGWLMEAMAELGSTTEAFTGRRDELPGFRSDLREDSGPVAEPPL